MGNRRLASDSPDYVLRLFKKELREQSKRLSIDKQMELLTLCRNEASEAAKAEAREELIVSLMPVAMAAARRFHKLGKAEAASVASLALVEAVDQAIATFDPERGPLVPYLQGVLGKQLLEAHNAASHIVHIPRFRHTQRKRIHKAARKLRSEGQTATPTAIAEKTHLLVAEVLNAGSINFEPAHSLDASLDKQQESENLTYSEVIADPKAPSPEYLLGTSEGREVLRNILQANLRTKQCEAVARFIGLDGEPMKVKDIATELGLTPATAKVYVTRAYATLRKIPYLKEFLHLLATPERMYGRSRIINVPPALQYGVARHDRPCSKASRLLTPEQVKEIRQRLAAGEKGKDLSEEFKVSNATISAIKTQRMWKDVTN